MSTNLSGLQLVLIRATEVLHEACCVTVQIAPLCHVRCLPAADDSEGQARATVARPKYAAFWIKFDALELSSRLAAMPLLAVRVEGAWGAYLIRTDIADLFAG